MNVYVTFPVIMIILTRFSNLYFVLYQNPFVKPNLQSVPYITYNHNYKNVIENTLTPTNAKNIINSSQEKE